MFAIKYTFRGPNMLCLILNWQNFGMYINLKKEGVTMYLCARVCMCTLQYVSVISELRKLT